MKNRSSRLRRIVSLAEAEERHHAEIARRTRARLTEESERLRELGAYRHKYARTAGQCRHLQAVHWKDQQSFLGRLDHAIRSQTQIVNDWQRKLDMHWRQWQEKRRRVESLSRVMKRFRAQERLHADRLEQRSLDDRPISPDTYGVDR